MDEGAAEVACGDGRLGSLRTGVPYLAMAAEEISGNSVRHMAAMPLERLT